MAGQITDLALGKFLQIAFTDGVRNQISEDYRDWEHIKMCTESDPAGRQMQFLLQSSYGPAAVQSRNAGSTAAFPKGQKSKNSEHTATYKEVDITVEVDYNLWNRTKKSGSIVYAKNLVHEMESKMMAAKRYMASKLYQDGSGIVAIVASAADSVPNNNTVVTINTADANAGRSSIGYLEYGDILRATQDVAVTVELVPAKRPGTTTGSAITAFGWEVTDIDRDADTFTVKPVDSDYNELTLVSSDLVAGDFFIRIGQECATAPSQEAGADRGSYTDQIVGLESLAANDGRLVHGITMSGSTAGSTVDNGGGSIAVSGFRQLLDKTKLRVGEGRYQYKKACLSPEAEGALVDARDDDRRFNATENLQNGSKYFAYQHRGDTVETFTSQYVPKSRIYILPEAKNGEKPLEYWGTDFESVEMEGSGKFHLKPSSAGGHERVMTSYMEAIGQLICTHPASIGVLKNFTV